MAPAPGQPAPALAAERRADPDATSGPSSRRSATAGRGDAARRRRRRAGRGRRQEGRRVPRDRRPVGRVRRRPGHRHAADRVDDRRRVDRRRAQRPAAGRRDPVRRLHPPGVQPDRVRGGPDALPLQRRRRRADGDPRAVRRRRPRRALPLAVRRGVLHPRARAQGRHPVDPVRRQGPAPDRDPRRRPGPVLRAQEDVPLGPRRGAGRRLHGPARPGRGHAGRAARSASSPTGSWSQYALEAAERLAAGGDRLSR